MEDRLIEEWKKEKTDEANGNRITQAVKTAVWTSIRENLEAKKDTVVSVAQDVVSTIKSTWSTKDSEAVEENNDELPATSEASVSPPAIPEPATSTKAAKTEPDENRKGERKGWLR